MICKEFKDSLSFLNRNLKNLNVNKVSNSIGSNIFVRFGEDVEVTGFNGKKWFQKEWTIWIGDALWKISKNNIYIVGSDDDRNLIIPSIDNLLSKKFINCEVISQFLDMKFVFEDGYELTTFINDRNENQWTLFMPTHEAIQLDFSTEEMISSAQSLSKDFTIKEDYKQFDFPLNQKIIDIDFDGNLTNINCENEISIELNTFGWRLEKNGNYYVGCLDDFRREEEFESVKRTSEIVGKKILKFETANFDMDARITIEDGYVLKLFTNSRDDYWKIFSKGEEVFSTNLSFL